MRLSLTFLCVIVGASSAAAQAQTHARHTAAHDSAHAIMLSDADHLALHALLLGHWTGSHGARHDTLDVRFENDSQHQQLMVRQHDGVTGFTIRGDSLQWKVGPSTAPCLASTSVATLLAATKGASPASVRMTGTIVCGANQSPFTLKKVG